MNVATRIIVLGSFALMTAGCATTNGSSNIDQRSFGQFLDADTIVAEVPSHGLIGDRLAISLGGGPGYVKSLRRMLLSLQESAGRKRILVTSDNRTLARTVLHSAVKGLPPDSLSRLEVGLAGQAAKGDDVIRDAIKARGGTLVMVR